MGQEPFSSPFPCIFFRKLNYFLTHSTLLRILRILPRLSIYSPRLHLTGVIVAESFGEFRRLMFCMGVFVTIVAYMIYHVETLISPDETKFDSVIEVGTLRFLINNGGGVSIFFKNCKLPLLGNEWSRTWYEKYESRTFPSQNTYPGHFRLPKTMYFFRILLKYGRNATKIKKSVCE